ncbi:MAG: Uncharacterised protein [Gammaproteobacteria bacterium]|nr:MAG: Uncharacterised protein [Gammaproteobacteria bacterium]
MEDTEFSFGDMCSECVVYLDRVVPTLADIVTSLRASPDQDTLVKLSHFDEGLGWLIEFGSKSDMFLVDDETRSEFAYFVSQVNDGSKAFVVALENKDYVDLADVLEYQFMPAMERLRDIVKVMIPH